MILTSCSWVSVSLLNELQLLIKPLVIPATWVGGIFINGTAEIVATPGYGSGLLWGTYPISAGLSLIFGKNLYCYIITF